MLCTLSRRRCAVVVDCGDACGVVVPAGFSTCPTLAAVAWAFVLATARLMFFSLDEMVMGSRWHGLDADANANGECGSMPILVTAADTAAEVAVEDADDAAVADDDEEWCFAE